MDAEHIYHLLVEALREKGLELDDSADDTLAEAARLIERCNQEGDKE